MFAQVVGMLSNAIANIANWFVTVLVTAEMHEYFIVSVFLLLLIKYLMTPLFGSNKAGSSDTVKRPKKG